MTAIVIFTAVITFIVILLILLFLLTAFIEGIWGDPDNDLLAYDLDNDLNDDLDYLEPPTPLLGVVYPTSKKDGN